VDEEIHEDQIHEDPKTKYRPAARNWVANWKKTKEGMDTSRWSERMNRCEARGGTELI
jgi:hypothetical protein